MTAVVSVAAPVMDLARRPRTGTCIGSVSGAAYLAFHGTVVALTARGVPRMPNGMSLDGPVPRIERGARVQLVERSLRTEGTVVARYGAAEVWEPTLVPWGKRAQIPRQGAALLGAAGIEGASGEPFAAISNLARDDRLGRGLHALLEAIGGKEPSSARRAAESLIGRGPGLTPAGDDLLAAAILGVLAFGAAAGLSSDDRRGLSAALHPPDAARRTTSLSATLLALSVRGHAIEPVLETLATLKRTNGAGASLRGVGASTGRMYLLGMGLVASVLAAPESCKHENREGVSA